MMDFEMAMDWFMAREEESREMQVAEILQEEELDAMESNIEYAMAMDMGA